jgi:hypothetical protein
MKRGPNIIVVILPEGGNDIYTAVKQYVHHPGTPASY